jgi:hypothetical protein
MSASHLTEDQAARVFAASRFIPEERKDEFLTRVCDRLAAISDPNDQDIGSALRSAFDHCKAGVVH